MKTTVRETAFTALEKLPVYFFDETETDRSAVSPELVAALQNDDLRDMTLRATGLSERSLRAIKEMIESARTVEGLPDDRRPRYRADAE